MVELQKAEACPCSQLEWLPQHLTLEHHPDCEAQNQESPSKADYYLCFRIVAWKAAFFADERWKLGPKYYCPLCDLPEKDLKAQPVACPACPLTSLYLDTFKDAAIDEIERRGGLPEGFTINGLINDYHGVVQVLSDNQERIDSEWDVAFVKLARIVLQEQNQMKFTNDWNTWKKMKSTSK